MSTTWLSSPSISSASLTRLTCSRNSSTLSASSARADQLGQVLEPALGLDRALLLQLDEVAGAVEQRLQQRRRLVVGGQVGDAVEQLEERGDALHRRAADAGVVGAAERVDEAEAVAGRVGVELADAASRRCPAWAC